MLFIRSNFKSLAWIQIVSPKVEMSLRLILTNWKMGIRSIWIWLKTRCQSVHNASMSSIQITASYSTMKMTERNRKTSFLRIRCFFTIESHRLNQMNSQMKMPRIRLLNRRNNLSNWKWISNMSSSIRFSQRTIVWDLPLPTLLSKLLTRTARMARNKQL